MARINRVGHVVLSVKDTEASVKFYNEALGMEIMSHDLEHHRAFLSFGTQHHDIALFQAPEGAERGKLGLNHIAMQIEGGVDELETLHQRLVDWGATIDHLSDHTITRSVYFLDPDGNKLEIFCEMMEMEEAREFMRDRGGVAQPVTR